MKEVKDEISKLQKEINALSKRMSVLANKRNALQELLDKPLVQSYVGKYFKYRNSDTGDSSWWLYVRVVGAAKMYKYAFVDSIEVVNGGVYITIHRESPISLFQGASGMVHEITEAEFLKQWKKFNKLSVVQTNQETSVVFV